MLRFCAGRAAVPVTIRRLPAVLGEGKAREMEVVLFSKPMVLLCTSAMGGRLSTTTLTGAEVETLPARSVPRAARVCVPKGAVLEFQGIEYGTAVSAAPRVAPSRRNWTDPTPLM